jgi:hypothetical protein
MISSPDRQFRLARIWSNQELARIGHLFSGTVVNVSAGEDEDKEGRTYAEYFPNGHSYSLTNYNPGSYRGYQGRKNEFLVDLTENLPSYLLEKFDVVFNHTTLEHIFEVTTAFRNICRLSRDIVILVVPFAQVQHENEGYRDFWRFTPTCMRRIFEDNGFHVIYEAANNQHNAAVYLFVVASRFPDRWTDKMPSYSKVYPAGEWIGKAGVVKHPLGSRFKRLKNRTRQQLGQLMRSLIR